VEVKNVTLVENNLARFPDAVTTRGQKHLKELMNEIQNGNRAVIFFLIQREDADSFAPADDIDPTYGKLLRDAFHAGVEIMAYQCKLSPEEISIWRKLPVML
jgi:sugar fermentation stimulation protein A